MRCWAGAVMLAAVLIANPAGAQDQRALVGFARTFSLLSEIASACPAVLPTDAGYATRFAAAARGAAVSTFGPEAWAVASHEEVARRRREVKATGAAPWCENQRRYLRENGDTGTFP